MSNIFKQILMKCRDNYTKPKEEKLREEFMNEAEKTLNILKSKISEIPKEELNDLKYKILNE